MGIVLDSHDDEVLEIYFTAIQIYLMSLNCTVRLEPLKMVTIMLNVVVAFFFFKSVKKENAYLLIQQLIQTVEEALHRLIKTCQSKAQRLPGLRAEPGPSARKACSPVCNLPG